MTSRSKALGTVVALLLIVGAFLLGRATGSEPDASTATPNQPGIAAVGPTEVVNGVPVGYEQSEVGAVSAASTFARVMANVTNEPDEYVNSWKRMSAPSWVSEAAELAETGFAFTTDRYGLGSTFTYSPVRFRVNDYSSVAASVDLWGVTVASDADGSILEESWTTLTIELSWVSGDWRMNGQSSLTGPTPELIQAGEVEPPGSLTDFEGFDFVPEP